MKGIILEIQFYLGYTMTDTYEVIIRWRIPYLTSFLNFCFALSLIISFIFYIFFVPKNNNEMHAASLLVLPKVVINIFVYSIISCGFFCFFHRYFRRHSKASLKFGANAVTVTGKHFNYLIPINKIIKVYCVDGKDTTGFPNGVATFYFKVKQKGIPEYILRVGLVDYSQVDDFVEKLINYDGLNFYSSDLTSALI